MMNKNNHSISIRRGMRAAFFLALAFVMTQPARAQSQWVTSGNNINNTNTGNVGIGVVNPNSRLSITPGMTEPKITLWDGGGTSAHFGFGISSNQLNYHVIEGASHVFYLGGKNGDGTPLMIIKNTGNVGIGVMNPNSRFSISPTITEPKITLWDGGGTSSHFGFGISDNQLNYHVIGGGNHVFYQGGKNGDGTPLMIVKSTGSVGIGTTNPTGLLHLRVGSGDVIHRLANAGNASGELDLRYKFESSQHRIGLTDNGGNWLFYTQWAFPFSSSIGYFPGNVGIGTNAPSSRLHVVGDVTLAGTGNINASGTVTAGNIVAKYQDIAEWVPSSKAMPAGTVVVLDTVQLHHVLPSSQAYDARVAGVISERPGLILGEGGEGKLMVATTGRVRVKVDATRAPIRAGDILVTSDKEGIAMRSEPIDLGGAKIHRPGTIIGKALEPLDKGIGEILVLLSLQ